ncbi:MAG: hypothetical protein A3D92_09110 [Bacteroidetes bacterium RIFCSPHIGHO2_02_FULL_44_7]|nr:MAG: hypothetical protein A3D92_09110 [Bacteroidetes bacterium RIFCSPHIGHO2_02_FULL_44_7]
MNKARQHWIFGILLTFSALCARAQQVPSVANSSEFSVLVAGLEENVILVNMHENRLKLNVLFFGNSMAQDVEPHFIPFEP